MIKQTTTPEPKGALLIGFLAFTIWGFLPLFLKQMHNVSSWVIVSERVLWTIPWALGISVALSGFSSLKTNRRAVFYLALSGVAIGLNWTIYTWAVAHDRIMEAAFGYFINPLMNIALGILIFKERLAPIKYVAIGLATLAVLYQGIATHHFPFVGLSLAALFSIYALIRKQIVIGPAAGLFWESLLISPFAIMGIVYLHKTGVPILGASKIDPIWLALTGPATAIPLTLFSYAARHLKMTSIGMLQYIAPSIGFVISIMYGEHFGIHQAITFGLIWAGLALYSWAEYKNSLMVQTK
jgi:chloramphenicol-sensitive protein RarD